MKLKFTNQDFQNDAVNTGADLFIGQRTKQATFSVMREGQINLLQNEYGVGNAMLIGDTDFLFNMNEIQKHNKAYRG